MKRTTLAVAAALSFLPAVAHAEDSEQGPFYIQGSVGVSYWDFPHIDLFAGLATSYSWTGFWPALELGYHFSGRHDGFVLGVRQAFIATASNVLGGHAGGTSMVRLGYDLAFKVGTFEINVDPYAMVGIGYIFDGLHAGIAATGGLDVKLFFTKGVYAFARPAELGIQCFEDSGICAFNYAAALGAGIALGK